MDIQIAALCDAATDSHGKLNILGTFDTINAAQLPAVHPQCSIALRLVFSKMEEGRRDLKLNFVDEDGKLVMPSIDIPVEVQVPEDTSFISRNFIIDVSLGGNHVGSIPLLVRHTPQQQQSAQES